MNADVLIVGAGLAGCTLGFLLRDAGRDVLSVELRDARDKDKLCAGVLDPGSVGVFDKTYGPGAFEGLSPFPVSNAITRCLDASCSERVGYWTLPRKRLDDYCLQRYVDAGGRLIDRASLVGVGAAAHVAAFRDLRSGEFEIGYNTLVGADGASSAVRRLLNGRIQHTLPSVQGTVPFLGASFVFEYGPQDLGYCWYIPHREDATVGCMLHGVTGARCRERLAEFCASMGIEVPALRGAPIPEGDDVLLRAGEDAWLVGDAAGLIDAFGGGGIAYALRSACVLAAALTGGKPYECGMEKMVADIERNYSILKRQYLRTCFAISMR